MRTNAKVRGVAALAILSVATAGVAMAQNSSYQTPNGTAASSTAADTASGQSATGLSSADVSFMKKAAQGGLAEVALGRVAQQQASDSQVKSFGERMVQDHTQANDKLMTLAQSLNVTLPTTPSKSDEKEMDKLKAMNGSEFDSAYARAMVKDHKKDIKEFEHAAMHASNPQVKAFAEETLPTLKQHLSLAEKLPEAKSASTASSTG